VRLVVWCVAFVVGDACALTGVLGWRSGVVAAVLAVLAIAVARGRRVVVAATVGFVVAGVVLGERAMRPAELAPGLAAAIARGEACAVVAEVIRGAESSGAGARLVVALTGIDGVPAAGTLALSVMRGWPDFGPGETIAFRAKLRALRGTRNPGLPDPTLALRAAGIEAFAGVGAPADITRIAAPDGAGPRRAAFVARRAMRGAIDRAVGGDAAAFLKTAVLGDRRGIGPDVEEGFRVAGATHVLSVSGLHLAAVAMLLFVLARAAAVRVPRLPLYVDPRAVAAAVALPAIAFYALLTGEAIATLRSALMLSLAMAAFLVGRRASPGPAIAAAALVLLAARPLQLLDVSLQLSLASVIGIALCARGIGPGKGDADGGGDAGSSGVGRRFARGALAWLWRFAAATVAATAATAPLVAHHFGEVAPLAPLGNLALVPLVELGVVPAGLLGAAAGAIWEPLGRLPLAVAAAAARAALWIAAGFRSHAPLWLCRTPNALETAALTTAGCVALIAIAARGRRRHIAAIAASAAALAAIASLAIRDVTRRSAPHLMVTFLDVGQGDAAVVEAPGGAVMVVDGGGVRDGAFDTGARIVEPFLRARGIGRVDVVALSHPHPDHMNGLFRIIQRFDVGALWTSGDDGRNPEYARLMGLARQRGIPTPPVAPAALGAVTIDPLGPFWGSQDGERVGAPEGLTVNDASLALRVGFAGRGVLFAGDLEADGEGELVGRRDAGQVVRSDVLKVPHHGSRTSSSQELVEAVAPSLAVMSLGWRNQFNFPAPEVVARYQARGTRVLRTDRDGAITVTIDRAGTIAVRCERSCPVSSSEPSKGSEPPAMSSGGQGPPPLDAHPQRNPQSSPPLDAHPQPTAAGSR
jgi:competence protein ComEC